MADFEGTITEGKIRGTLSIWPSVLGGVMATLVVLGIAEHLAGDDSNPGTYKSSDLELVTFTPDESLECRGHSVKGSSQIIDSTIICVPVEG